MDKRIYILASDLLEPDEKVIGTFDKARRERLARMKSGLPRNEVYTSGVLIEQIRPEDAEIGYEENGKPYFFYADERFTESGKKDALKAGGAVKRINRSFSITHSAGRVFCVWSDEAAVGADYESKNRKVGHASVRRLCTEKETDFFNTIHDKTAADEWLIKLFTRKEAVSKLTGEGINTDFTRMEDKAMTERPFESDISGEIFFTHDKRTDKFRVRTESVSGGFLSIVEFNR